MSPRPVVLCVDDDPAVLAGLRLTLHPLAEVLSAGSGDEALALLRTREVNVLIVDEQMPGTPGRELLRRVSQLHPDTVRIVLTGHANVSVALAALNELGVFRLLEKPCSPERLRATVDSALQAQALAERGSRLLHAADEGGSVPLRLVRSTPPDPLQALGAARALLTAREAEVVAMIAEGWRLSHIARSLFVSAHTVRNHLKAIFRKLEVHSQVELLERLRRVK